MSHPVIAFLIVLGVLVFFHELGHYLAARWCNVGIQVFSLGFGPKLLKKTVGITQYCVSAIPLGGYVKMVGDDPDAEISEADRAISFHHKALWQKCLIVFAGPGFNFLLGIGIFYLFFQFSGIDLPRPEILEVIDSSPAAEAGIMAGDVFVEINGKTVESFDQVRDMTQESNGAPLTMVLDRNGEFIRVSVTPEPGRGTDEFGRAVDRYLMGIKSTGEYFHRSLSPLEAVGYSFSQTWLIIRLSVVSVGLMVTGQISTDNLGGPIKIAKAASETAKAGWTVFANFIAVISISLGLINLFPIPVLDGGHLMFFGIEAVTRKPVNEKVRGVLTQIGLAMLVVLMVFVIYNDIFNGG